MISNKVVAVLLSNCCHFLRKDQPHRRTLAQRAFNFQARAVRLGNSLDQRQSQPASAAELAAGAVNPVKRLGYAGDFFRRNAFAMVGYLEPAAVCA